MKLPWTNETPTEPGWYLRTKKTPYRVKSFTGLSVYLLVSLPNGLFYADESSSFEEWAKVIDGYWWCLVDLPEITDLKKYA